MENHTVQKWMCCGHDIADLCNRAGCSLPERCFFCGLPRRTVTLLQQPEDALAFELAELWCGKIRESPGRPYSSSDETWASGSPYMEAWRTVARRVLELRKANSSLLFPPICISM